MKDQGSAPVGLAAHFGPLELAILEVVWARGEVDVAVVTAALSGGQAYTTVKTVMERLTDKGHLSRHRAGRSYLYAPTETRDEVEERLASSSAQALLTGFGSLAVAGFVDSVQGDPARLAHLRRLLEQVGEGR